LGNVRGAFQAGDHVALFALLDVDAMTVAAT
jgi:hypothetical protein